MTDLCSEGAGFLAYYAIPKDAVKTPILSPRKVCDASTALSDPRSLPCCSIAYWSLSLPPEILDLIADLCTMNRPRSGRVAPFPSRGSRGSEGIF